MFYSRINRDTPEYLERYKLNKAKADEDLQKTLLKLYGPKNDKKQQEISETTTKNLASSRSLDRKNSAAEISKVTSSLSKALVNAQSKNKVQEAYQSRSKGSFLGQAASKDRSFSRISVRSYLKSVKSERELDSSFSNASVARDRQVETQFGSSSLQRSIEKKQLNSKKVASKKPSNKTNSSRYCGQPNLQTHTRVAKRMSSAGSFAHSEPRSLSWTSVIDSDKKSLWSFLTCCGSSFRKNRTGAN